MATVRNTIMMNDSMGSVIKSIVKEMDMAIGTMERMDTVSSRLDLGSGLSTASTAGLQKGILMLDGSIHQVGAAQQQVNNQIRDGTGALNAAAAAGAGLKRSLDPIDDEIRRSNQEQQKFNRQMKDGAAAAGELKSLLATIGTVIGIRQLGSISDSYTLISGRLGLIKGEMETVDQLQDKIFAAANDARGLYTDMAGSVSKLALLAGDAFGSNDEIIRFTELYQKMGTIGGSSGSETSNGMYQLNQAMASGRLQGDEYRSIIENAPMLAQAIEDYMINVQHAGGSMKDWASEGLLTSEVIKAAMFSVADEVDKTFSKLPLTWGQLWNVIVNHIMIGSEPLLRFINLLANNWSILGPIVYGVVAALILYGSVMAVTNTLQAIDALGKARLAAASMLAARNTFAQTVAQHGLNAALLACPITWIIIGIVALIAIFYAGVAAVNKFAGTSLSATGIIMGAFFAAGAFIINILIGLANYFLTVFNYIWNLIATFAEFFANVFDDPVASVARLFLGLFDVILGAVQGIAGALDTVFGSDLASAVSGFRGDLQNWADGKFGEQNVKIQRDIFGQIDRINYGDAWNKGYGIGSDLQDKAMGMFGSGFNMDDVAAGLADQEYDVNVKDDVNLADESLEYLLDAVTQRYVNNVNVTAPAPTVQVTFAGDINRDVDLDELAEKTKTKIGTELVEYAMSSTDIKR